MTTRIVTADDLGLREDVDRGIVLAHRLGIVTHASWLAGGETARDAVSRVRSEAPGLRVGLHLALSQVRPSGDPAALAGLVAGTSFPRRQFRAARWSLPPARRAAILDEWRAQADAFEDAWGHTPTHLDSHQHVHLAPWLTPLAIQVARERGIPRLRAARRSVRFSLRLDAIAFSLLMRRASTCARQAGIASPDHFAGFEESGHLSGDALWRWERSQKQGVTEWMTHPGLLNEPDGYQRCMETRALIRYTLQTRRLPD